MARHTIINIFGWIGVVAVLLAYVLVSLDYARPSSLPILALNMSGAITIGIVSYIRRAFQPLILQVAWFVIAFVTAIRAIG